MVVDSEFSVLLWSKALVLDLDQAEQQCILVSYLLRYAAAELDFFYC